MRKGTIGYDRKWYQWNRPVLFLEIHCVEPKSDFGTDDDYIHPINKL